MVDSSIAPSTLLMPTGTCILAEGVLQKPSLQGKHTIELKAEKLLHIGIVDQDNYPLSKKSLPLARLRDCAHFRPRTTTVRNQKKLIFPSILLPISKLKHKIINFLFHRWHLL